MKTAEEILNEQKFGFSREQKESALIAMRIYANQKLDLAAENACPDYMCYKWELKVDKYSILQFKDII